jgi:hypothetical protein
MFTWSTAFHARWQPASADSRKTEACSDLGGATCPDRKVGVVANYEHRTKPF